MTASPEQRLKDLESASQALYDAGHWTCDRGSAEHQVKLWEDLRDALGRDPGSAPKKPGKTDVSIAVANEADGDLAGFYLFDDDIDQKYEASGQDIWEFISDNHDDVVRFDSIAQAISYAEENNLVITGDFGVCVY